MIRNQVVNALEKATGIKNPALEFPENEQFGDYSSNAALVLSKERGVSPRKLAEEIVSKLEANKQFSEIVEKIEVAGPGFINFWLKKDTLVGNLIQIDKEKEKYGQLDFLKKKKIVLEFTDPNPFKEFHIGHLYTNTVGESLSRLLGAVGAEIKRVNYQGDIGLHVAKAIWGMLSKFRNESVSLNDLNKKPLEGRIKFMGEAYALGARAYEEDGVSKEEINSLNKKIFDKDPETLPVYQKGREWSLEYFEKIYKRLGTKFDSYYFESEVGRVGAEIVKENLEKGIFEKSNGAIIFPGSKYGLHDRVFINSLGLPTYEAKELGLAPTKYKNFKYDESIIITGNEINDYFKVLIKAMTLIYPELGQKTKHIGHGMVRLPEGKMSSRTGKVVTGEFLLDSVKGEAEKINKDSAEMVAIAAVKYSFLKVGIGNNITFDIGESLSLEGNSGPYLQYTVARTNSVLEKVDKKFSAKKATRLNEEEISTLRTLIRFSDVIETAAKNYSPNLICNYLYELASKYNAFYNKHRILDSDNLEFRLSLTSATGQVLKNGLILLGINAPERM